MFQWHPPGIVLKVNNKFIVRSHSWDGHGYWTCHPDVRNTRAQLSKWRVDLMSGMTWISPGAYVWMAAATRVCYMEHCFPYSDPSIYLFPGIRLHRSSVENWFQNNNLVVYMCDYASWFRVSKFALWEHWNWTDIHINHGPVLIKCPSVSDLLSTVSVSVDNSDMDTWFNQ